MKFGSDIKESSMSIPPNTLALKDNGGRRLLVDRRRFSYTEHIPDRRLGRDRRSAIDRRSGVEQRAGQDLRVAFTTALVS
jgi:hypothetical protein